VRYNFNNSTSIRHSPASGGREPAGQPLSVEVYGGKRTVSYRTSEKPGTIIVSTRKRKLYYVLDVMERPSSTALVLDVPVSRGRVLLVWARKAVVASLASAARK
jgi:lipoprotein-anchoring transpeptidase ErfK/SrfK